MAAAQDEDIRKPIHCIIAVGTSKPPGMSAKRACVQSKLKLPSALRKVHFTRPLSVPIVRNIRSYHAVKSFNYGATAQSIVSDPIKYRHNSQTGPS